MRDDEAVLRMVTALIDRSRQPLDKGPTTDNARIGRHYSR
jgi:hypothetical protein